MSTQLFSERLLEKEIKKYKENPPRGDDKILYYICAKELEVIKKLKIDVIDMTGTIEEFGKRLKNQHIYFMLPEEFQEIRNKARKYDEIINFINRQDSPIY